MSEFNITLARIEAVDEGEQGKQIRAVFHIERDLIGFNVPIYLRARDFDNSEMVQAAKFTASDVRRTRQPEQNMGAFAC